MERLGGLIRLMPLTAFTFLVGCGRHLGAAAVQRLRLRMADLPGDPARSRNCRRGAEAAGAGGRGVARAVGGARRRVLRQGVRHNLPRPARATEAAKRAAEADRFSLAAMFALAALCLIAGVLPGLFIDALGAGGEQPRRRPDAGADGDRLAVDRARSPRAAAPTTAFSCSCSSSRPPLWAPRRSIGSPPTRCEGRRPGIAAFPSRPGDAIHGRQFRRADSARVRRLRFRRPRRGRHAGAGRHASGAHQGRDARPRLGNHLSADRRRGRPIFPPGSIGCSFSPSGNI